MKDDILLYNKEFQIKRKETKHLHHQIMNESILRKKPCHYWDQCPLLKKEEHKKDFHHPCRYGVDCKLQNNSVHIERFVHPCQHGKDCPQIKLKEDSLILVQKINVLRSMIVNINFDLFILAQKEVPAN